MTLDIAAGQGMGVGSARHAPRPRLRVEPSAADWRGRAGSLVEGWGEEFGHEVDGVPVAARQGVGVDVHGGGGAGVAEPLRDHRHRPGRATWRQDVRDRTLWSLLVELTEDDTTSTSSSSGAFAIGPRPRAERGSR
jgi:hypothetical protein